MARSAASGSSRRPAKAATSRASLPPPPFQAVQLATLVDHVPEGNRWVHELKFDGYRCLISVGGGVAHAFTRSGLDWSDKFAPIVEDAQKLPARAALIDGEAVVVNVGGKTNFQALQSAIKGEPQRIEYYAFDLLSLDGEDLTRLPLVERKEKLAALLEDHDGRIHYSDHIVGQGEALFDKFCGAGLEGISQASGENRGSCCATTRGGARQRRGRPRAAGAGGARKAAPGGGRGRDRSRRTAHRRRLRRERPSRACG